MADIFFTLSKILPALLYPYPLALIAVAVHGVLRQSWLQRFLWLGPLAALWILSSPAGIDPLLRQWEVPLGPSPDNRHESWDVVVVLGGLSVPEQSDPAYTEFSGRVERLLVPLELWKDGRAGRVLISSGSGKLLDQELREADSLAAYARRWGIDAADLIVERDSRNTRENAINSLDLIRQGGGDRVLVVTSAFHLRRTRAIFRKLGTPVDLWAVDSLREAVDLPFAWIPDPGNLAKAQMVLKEVLGYGAYGLMGWL